MGEKRGSYRGVQNEDTQGKSASYTDGIHATGLWAGNVGARKEAWRPLLS
jgi:hypothetical protein